MNNRDDSEPIRNQEPAEPPPPSPIPTQNEAVLPSAEEKPTNDRIHVAVNVPRETRPIEWIQLAISAALAVIGVFAICIYGGQLNVMRQQLVGSQGAVLDMGISFNDGSGELLVQLINNGHVTATNIHLKVEASERSLRDDTLIGAALQFEPPVAPILSGRGFAQTWILTWHVTERERQQGGSWPSDWPGTRTFVFHGEVTYQDGFGDEIKQEMCREWLPGFTIVNKGRTSAGGGLYECGSVKTFIASTLEQEKEAEQSAKKPN